MTEEQFIEMLVASWPAPFVARSETGKFTGGCVSPGTIANVESSDEKVPGRITVGRQIAYPTREYAAWLAKYFLKNIEA